MNLRNKLTAVVTTGIMLTIFSFTACRKNTIKGGDDGFAADQASLERTFDDVQNVADNAYEGNTAMLKGGPTPLSGPCAIITHDTLSSPHLLTIDFGSTNCLCGDGNYRRGKIIVSYTGHYKDSGSAHTITFDNYFVNDNQVTGSKSVTNMGTNTSGQYYYSIHVDGAIILAGGAGTRSWTSDRVRTWTNGYSTSDWHDDEYDITGSATITRVNGTVVSMSITTSLHIAMTCQWIESGVITFTPSGGTTRTLDYGDGTCDALAQLTIDGTTYNITLN